MVLSIAKFEILCLDLLSLIICCSETEVDLAQEFKNFVAKIRLKKTQDSKAGLSF